MSPRVAYWTNSFEPAMEAVASEVASLRRAFPGSAAWGVSPRDTRLIGFKNGLSFHPRAGLAFRAVTAVLQWRFDLNHVFGSLADWHHLRAIWKRPTVMTVCLGGEATSPCLDRVDRFAVEWPAAKEQLLARGVEPQRVSVVFPPVDLERFRPVPALESPFTVLFASSPDRAAWLADRGMWLLLDAAALCPEMQFRLVWRPWGDSLPAVKQEIARRELSNVEIVCERVADMSRHYATSHVVAAPFLDQSRCKPVPNSVLEGLACARPAVVTREVGVADLILGGRAGLVCENRAASLADCLRQARQQWTSLSKNARALAESKFAAQHFVNTYRKIYARIAGSPL